MKKRMRRVCLPLMLSLSMILGMTSSASAEVKTDWEYAASSCTTESGHADQASITASADDIRDSVREVDGTAVGNGVQTTEEEGKPENLLNTGAPEDGDTSSDTPDPDAVDSTEDGNAAEDAVKDAENDPDKKDGDLKPGDLKPGDLKPEDDPEETPYEELLADEDLILVTVSESEPDSGMIVEETVEELSESEILAVEEYVEEQGYAVTVEAMLAAAPKTVVRTITFNMNGFLSLEAEGFGYGYDAMFYIKEGDFQGNANGYCINPSVQAPGHDQQGREITYMATITSYSDPMLLKILYYGFGGPGDISGKYASGNPARHILTHMVATKRAAELGIPGAGDYTYRANARAIGLANQLYAAIKAKAAINGSVSIFTPVPGQQTIMLLSSFSVPPVETPKTEITVKKTVSGTGGNKNTEFHFKLTVFSPEGKAATVKTFTLQHGQTATFKDLPQGVRYTVEELDGESQGYTVTAKNASGVLGKNPTQVSFENRKEMIVPTGVEVNTLEMGGITLLALLSGLVFLF